MEGQVVEGVAENNDQFENEIISDQSPSHYEQQELPSTKLEVQNQEEKVSKPMQRYNQRLEAEIRRQSQQHSSSQQYSGNEQEA